MPIVHGDQLLGTVSAQVISRLPLLRLFARPLSGMSVWSQKNGPCYVLNRISHVLLYAVCCVVCTIVRVCVCVCACLCLCVAACLCMCERVSCSASWFSDEFFHEVKYDLLMWNFILCGMS